MVALPDIPGLLDGQKSRAVKGPVAIYDYATGKRLSPAIAFRFFHRFIEVDPATRIGLAFGPIGKGLPPFSY
jgi:hypothetical protein